MGLPVREFRLNAAILCREEERVGHGSWAKLPVLRDQSIWHLDFWRQGFCPVSIIKVGPKGAGLLPKPCCKVLGNATSGVLKVGFRAGSISTAWECARNADAQASSALWI